MTIYKFLTYKTHRRHSTIKDRDGPDMSFKVMASNRIVILFFNLDEV